MNPDVAFVLFALGAVLVVCIPSVILGVIGWKISVNIQKEWLRTFVRAGVLATAFTPTIYGHSGPLPALWGIFILPGWDRLYYSAYPILFVWILGFGVAMFVKRIKRRTNVLKCGSQ